jgi:hypothetical protein
VLRSHSAFLFTQELFTAQRGIKLLDENIQTTFAGDEINLQVSIKRIEDM